VDASVQTEGTKSIWQIVKDWFRETFSIRSSELDSLGQVGVENWRNNLDSIQSVSLNDSESPLTAVMSNSSLHQLVGPDDSASQIS
jgi:U3 small nucleolar ribonucleoprotein component